MFYWIFLSFSLYFVSGNNLNVNIEYGNNNTFIFSYNITTNYSYYLTFRLFEHEQIKFGLFHPSERANKFPISNSYNTSTTLFYLFIICFHFIRPINDLDIQCKDIRLLKYQPNKSHLPSYKPLFVPLMYALSVLMLLPVIIQHRRRKQAQLIERRKQLRRLSITIAQDNPNILSNFVENGNINLKRIPIQIELVSLPSIKTILDDIDDNDNITYALRNLPTSIIEHDENDDDDDVGVTADDCIAHLLNTTPWNSNTIPQISASAYSMNILQEQQFPMITKFFDDDDDDRRSISRSNTHSTVDLYRSNPAFIESDV